MSHSATDLGCIKNFEVFERLLSVNGKRVIDAGCGSMTIAKELAARGANVVAIDPDPIQAEKNRNADPLPGIEFIESGADKLPVEDGSVDGVVFGYSLHHIPIELHKDVMSEVIRVLNPDGFLYTIEPMGCPLNEVMKLFHDEDKERDAAQQSIQNFAAPHFNSIEFVTYHSFTEYESFEAFAEHFCTRSFNSLYTDDDVRNDRVEAEFIKQGAPDFRFKMPKQVACLRGLKNGI